MPDELAFDPGYLEMAVDHLQVKENHAQATCNHLSIKRLSMNYADRDMLKRITNCQDSSRTVGGQ